LEGPGFPEIRFVLGVTLIELARSLGRLIKLIELARILKMNEDIRKRKGRGMIAMICQLIGRAMMLRWCVSRWIDRPEGRVGSVSGIIARG
jgi:hypothetical protein